MRRTRLTALAAVVTMVAAGAGSAPAVTNASGEKAVPGAAGAAASGRCATWASGLRFTRAARAKAGRLSWTAPARPAGARLRYRVVANGRRVVVTSRRSARVVVRAGHRYRFSVAVVRRGHVQAPACRATRTLTVRVLPPGRPGRLAVRVSGTRAALAWVKSRPGDGRLAGYRIARNGKTVRQTRRTRSTVTVSATAPQRLTVRAVDSRGRLSAPATVATGPANQAPQAPGALRATSVTESTVGLEWDPARAGGARIVGYRVFRDGRALGQVAATQITVPRLDAAQAYTFTVAAVDGRGRVSPPSRALTVATSTPPPSTGSLHAFVLASTGSSFEDFKAHYRQIGAIHATYFECDRATGAVAGRDNPQITSFAKLRQVEVYARFDCQSGPVLHRILTEPALRGAWLQTMVSLATQNGYDGVNVDFEAGAPADRAALTSFVAELGGRLHAIGKKVAVDVSAKAADDPAHPRSGMYDYPALARAADVVFVMAWGIHWSTSAPGPIADMPWLQSIVSYVNTLPDRQKYVMGTPMYGMDWPRLSGAGAPARALEWSEVAALAARVGIAPGYDVTAHEARFAYIDQAGVRHQVWASNAPAVLERMRLFRTNGYGVGVWRLGREDQAMWSDPLLG